ncbi:MAG: PaaI family thioesterase [Gammaproteobacteria bacterium]|nr:PaaI family thioesterase [Gammaproteobacteria bacterium]
MSIIDALRAARQSRDYRGLGEAMPYIDALGITVTESPQGMLLTLAASSIHVGNPFTQALHGGFIGAFLETAAIVQLILEQDSDSLPKPINITVDYLRGGRVADTRAAARVTKLGRRVANVHASCWQDDPERPIATLSGHFLMS